MSLKLGGSKSNSSTNSSGSFDRTDTPQVPDWINFRTRSLDQDLAEIGGIDPYSLVAGADPLQQQAATGAAGLNARPWNYDAAADLTRGVANSAAPTFDAASFEAAQASPASLLENLEKYMSPYTGQVVDAALADFDYGAGQTRAQQALEMAGAGAFGGSGSALARSQTEDALARGRASTSATLRDEGFRVGAGLSDSDAARRQAASIANAGFAQDAARTNAGFAQDANRTNAQLDADNRQRQLASAQQLANLSGQLGAEERATLDTQAGLGDMMRTIAGEEASAPVDFLAQQIALLSGLNPQMFIGNRATGTETGTSKTKGSQLAASASHTYGGKD
ncbi:hypothetical protein [Phenylobacterium sp.]|uniref:hypothetical protein n=1 Tax=Phenylobacterium sp. TaxID=1871053 RepID=UPI002602616F|nr:hypothetical protein [Phenylobacterium sp.]